MVRSIIRYGLFTAVFLHLVSFSTGPSQAGDVTGSPLTSTVQNCFTCHTGGNYGTTTSIALLNAGSPVSTYEPGADYTLMISISTQQPAQGYGFQAVAMDANNASAGTYGTAPSGFRVATIAGRPYVEHSRLQTRDTLSINWTAPDSGTGMVTFYAVGNAVNGNATNTGDDPAAAVLQLPEAVSSGTAAAWPADWRLGPNPASDHTTVSFPGEAGATVQLSDARGCILIRQVSTGDSATLDLGQLPGGVYVLSVLTRAGHLRYHRLVVE